MDGICAVVYFCDFGRPNPLVLVLYGDFIIFARHLVQFTMWCLKILARDVDLKDNGVRQVAYNPELCSFRFTGVSVPWSFKMLS